MAAITKLGLSGTPFSQLNSGRYDGKTVATAFQSAILIWQFDLWREGYAGAIVEVFKEGTTTHASLYTDVNLTQAADNPQTLLSQTLNGRDYGKFQESIYTPDAYYLVINGIESTGVFYPGIRTLTNEDATGATVESNNGGVERSLGERAADDIHVRDFGNFLEVDGSTTENTTTLTAAIGVASAANGGRVILPAGTFQVSTFNLPADVVLVGQGRNATIIQSEEADNVITVTGAKAGMEHLTLDGVNLNPGSVGIFGRARAEFSLTEAQVKRFETGINMQGGNNHHYTNLFVVNCSTGAVLRGDLDASNTDEGAAFTDLTWRGGSVTESTVYGLHLRYVDAALRDLTVHDVVFEDNVGTSALYIEGAEAVIVADSTFVDNTIRHVLTADHTSNDVENIEFHSCRFTGDEIKIGGNCLDFVFDRCIFETTVTFNLNSPENPIMLRDAIEDGTTAVSDATEKLSRWRTIDAGVYRGSTASGTSTITVIKRQLNPGDVVHMEVLASAVRLNAAGFSVIKNTAAAYCPAATLDFDGQTANFTAGQRITGGTSGAYGTLQSQTDAGATGTLNLIRVNGTFQNNEALSSTTGGAAVADGTLTYQNAVMMPPVQIDHYAQSAGATTWNTDVTTSGREIRVRVLGVTTGQVDWNVMIRQNNAPTV